MHDVAMRLLFVGVILAGGALAAPAQERQAGAKVGPSLGVVAFEPEQGERYGRRIGAAGGGFVVLPAGRHLAAQIEALFNRKGAKLDDQDTEATATILIDYLDFPFLMRMNGPRSGTTAFHVFGGPYLGIRTGARRQVAFAFSGFTSGVTEDMTAEVKRFDGGLVAGGGADIGPRFVIDGRYSWGLTSLNTDKSDGLRIRNRVLTILAGVRF